MRLNHGWFTICFFCFREKEKAELKDRKILEILQIKDDRIAELERVSCGGITLAL